MLSAIFFLFFRDFQNRIDIFQSLCFVKASLWAERTVKDNGAVYGYGHTVILQTRV